MAPVAMIFGGISGTISALFSWLLFGLTFWGAMQVYFIVGFCVAVGLIAMALLRPMAPANPTQGNRATALQRA